MHHHGCCALATCAGTPSFFFSQERLKIAKEFGDRAAERRAHSNLGNAHIFLGEFEKAAEHYKKTLLLAQELADRAVEAQACYSLGNTYTLLKDYQTAVDYHLRHLRIAQELMDKVGEGRACWSLGNAHSAMGQHKEAYQYATRHLEISKETGDRMGQATAQLNIGELSKTLGFPEDKPPAALANANANAGGGNTATDTRASRRISMERMDLLKMTPDVKGQKQKHRAAANGNHSIHEEAGLNDSSVSAHNKSGLVDEEDFFDFITRFQSKRMDDQRCSLAMPPAGTGVAPPAKEPAAPAQDLMKRIAAVASPEKGGAAATANGADKPDGFLPGLTKAKQPEILQRLSVATNNDQQFPDESFFEMLMKCQGSRIEDQRSSLPPEQAGAGTAGAAAPAQQHAPTVPDEDFFSLISKLQGGRLEDQRASLPQEPKEK